jgi:AraC-like DNA-binding protein
MLASLIDKSCYGRKIQVMLYLLQFYTFFIVVCLVLSNSLGSVLRNYFLMTIALLAVYAEATSSMAGRSDAYFYTSLLARAVFIPSAFLYFRNRINECTWSLKDLFHLLPFCSLIIAGGIIYAYGPASNGLGQSVYFHPGSTMHSALLLLIYVTASFYFFNLLLLFKHKAKAWFEKESIKNIEVHEEVIKNIVVPNGNIVLTEKQILRMDQLVKDYLETNKPFLQHRYSLKDLSDGTNIPLHHLSAFINKHYGVNYNDFINGFRVEYCKQKILNRECEQKKLEAIAQESGFSNRNTFTSAFKKVTGINPSEFVKSAQLNDNATPVESPEMEEPASMPMRYKLAVDHYS